MSDQSLYYKQWYAANREKKKAKSQEWRSRNKDRVRQVCAVYSLTHKEQLSVKSKEWRKANPKKTIDYVRKWQKQALISNPKYILEQRLRSRIRFALKDANTRKSARFIDLLGCSVTEFVLHITMLFSSGMTWKNKHLWHIDHIQPCFSFDLSKPEQQKQCFHWSNLQPLWIDDHKEKTRQQR